MAVAFASGPAAAVNTDGFDIPYVGVSGEFVSVDSIRENDDGIGGRVRLGFPLAYDNSALEISLFSNSLERDLDGEDDYQYWYVLTYLPDLQWCHVAPLEQRGVFESSKGASAGRPKLMLVSEEQGGEIDVGAGRCVVMEAREMKKTKENADEEEWDVLGPAAGQ